MKIKRVGLSLAVMVPAIAWASAREDTSEQALRDVCSEFSQAQMRECLAEKAATSEKALKQNEIRAHDAISKWDEHANYIRIAQEKLARPKPLNVSVDRSANSHRRWLAARPETPAKRCGFLVWLP